MKKIIALILAFSMIFCLAACANTGDTNEGIETKKFVDSLGRELEVPAKIEKIAVSGPLTLIPCFALCPDMLVGVANAWNKEAEGIIDAKYYNLPLLGQLYGGKGELNLETLLNSGAQVVIDIGEVKSGAADELDALTEQTGIPFVHIDATTKTMNEAYTMLGELLGLEKEAKVLADYCTNKYAEIEELVSKVEKKNMLYVLGAEGHNIIAKGSYQSEIIDLMSNNLAVVDNPSAKGSGNEVDFEQILTWNPDYVIFANDSIYDSVKNDETWKNITAIKEGHYYEVPFGPYNWLGFPPSVQRYLGLMWLSKVLYPESYTKDLYSEVKEYYSMFYHCNLTQEQYDKLVENSIK